jgi:1-acyl-sn-glycerol-3-phosphate acyltransferase
MSEADRQLSEGRSVVIFPEGTRSRDGHLLPLKKGAFVLALKNKAPILPVTVSGSFAILPKGTLRMGNSEIRVHLGKPIPTAGKTLDSKDELKLLVESWMKKTLSGFNQSSDTVSNEVEGKERE